jgi:hypothetical protein
MMFLRRFEFVMSYFCHRTKNSAIRYKIPLFGVKQFVNVQVTLNV